MATSKGQRITDTHLVTLTNTVGAKKICTLAGALAGAQAFGFVTLEGGISGDKIAVAIGGVAVIIAGASGVTAAGDRVESDGSGLAQSYTNGVIIGRALNSAASGEEVQVVLGSN